MADTAAWIKGLGERWMVQGGGGCKGRMFKGFVVHPATSVKGLWRVK